MKSGWFNAECMLYMAVVALANFSLPSTEMSYALKFIRIICLHNVLFWLGGFVGGIVFTFCPSRSTAPSSASLSLFILLSRSTENAC